VLEFSCHWACTVDVLGVAVEKAAKEIRWLVHSCSRRNSNSRCLNSGTVSVAAAFKKSSTEATSCRALVLLDTVSKPCGLLWEAFYDTLYDFQASRQKERVLRGHGGTREHNLGVRDVWNECVQTVVGSGTLLPDVWV